MEHVFDGIQGLGDAELIASLGEALRDERRAASRRLIAAGVFAMRRDASADPRSAIWCVDAVDSAAAEVGAELGISRFRAAADMRLGITLVARFPLLAERCLAGDVDQRVIASIDDRTALVGDPEILARLDVTLARSAPGWNGLSRRKLEWVLDWLVLDVDPEAVRLAKEREATRYVTVTSDDAGTSRLDGRLPVTDGDIVDRRLDAMASAVCDADPRTKDQRRADALVRLAEGFTTLACRCGTEACSSDDSSVGSSQIVVHVLAEAATVVGESSRSGFVVGRGPVRGGAVEEMVRSGRAKVRPVAASKDLGAVVGYRPTRAAAEFVLCRDLTCRWPGCDRPADRCDDDHTIPWPYGPTHPSNLKAYCRHHHLLKTFWTGPGGWSDAQRPDGTVVVTSPTGRTYASTPLGALFFPHLAVPTGSVVARPVPPAAEARQLTMPRRRRTRAEDVAARIEGERAVNRAEILAHPPPF
ncbi:hypothetical protein BEL07_09680 [Mycolicibacterium grossiae]|uniref:DUF222 domain-containing protein n=1 Tax=Mycolicibacterium grossiae TaxID=1552759 RepID=A0A1E8Q6W8_9MYCO|nr:hypothetical protein BEL07_09680 [Mycolicibacterium grossiae]